MIALKIYMRMVKPAYQSRSLSDKDFEKELGVSLVAVGVKKNHAETVAVKCESSDWQPPQSLLVKLPEGRLLVLWQGIFLVLKSEN
jgi:hypothetical protein